MNETAEQKIIILPSFIYFTCLFVNHRHRSALILQRQQHLLVERPGQSGGMVVMGHLHLWALRSLHKTYLF